MHHSLYRSLLVALLIWSLGVPASAQVVGPLTFDDLPTPVIFGAHDVVVPGFVLVGGFVTYRVTTPGNKFYYGTASRLCTGCTQPFSLFTMKGARNLKFDIVSANPGADIYDGGRWYFAHAGQTVTIPESSGATHIYYSGPTQFPNVAIDNISYERPLTDAVTLNLDIETDPAVPSTIGVELTKPQASVKIALGSYFKLRLTTKKAPGAPVEELRISHAIQSHSIAPALDAFGKHLYPEVNLISVAPASMTATDQFVAVHLGQVRLKLLPTSPDFPAVDVSLDVVPPSFLGSEENGWDSMLTDVAHQRGIPPQYLKGQVAQESPGGRQFVRVSYRYEPCAGEDAMRPLIDRLPYSLFKLEDARSSTLPGVTLDERNAMYVPSYEDGRITGRRRLTRDDRDVSAAEIFKGSDKWPIGSQKARGLNWGAFCGAFRTWRKANPNGTTIEFADAKLNFTAQTATAASRGLFQIMYYTAVDQQWFARNRATGETSYDPYLLQDTRENHTDWENGGSVLVGSNYSARKMGITPASFASRDEYLEWLRSGFQRYNPHKAGYGAELMDKSTRYPPLQPTS